MAKNFSNQPTSKHLQNMLSNWLVDFEKIYEQKTCRIIEAWPMIIGEKFSSMTRAVSLNNKVLVVTVNNSTLYSLLCQHEKTRLLKKLQKQFSKNLITDIRFKIG